jgi:hypothetical protein
MANQKTLFRRGVLQILEAERSCSIDDLVARIGERSGNLSSAINVLTSGPFVLSVGRLLYALRPVLDACRPLLPASFTAEDLLLLPPVQEFAQLVARGAGLPPLALAGTVAKRIASTGVATPIGPTTYCRTDVFKQLPAQIAGLFGGFTVRSLDEVSLAVGVDRSVTTHVVHGIMRDGRLMPLADDQYCSADCAKNVIACFRRARTSRSRNSKSGAGRKRPCCDWCSQPL